MMVSPLLGQVSAGRKRAMGNDFCQTKDDAGVARLVKKVRRRAITIQDPFLTIAITLGL
jgi:hypothetical protein